MKAKTFTRIDEDDQEMQNMKEDLKDREDL